MEWIEAYNLLKEYKDKNHNVNVPAKFVTDATYSIPNFSLGSWVNSQRCAYQANTLLRYRKVKLNELGMIWNSFDYTWNKYYTLACNYYTKYGNLDVPTGYKTKDGINYDDEGLPLANWIHIQRNQYQTKTLYEEREYLLNLIGMIWNCYDNTWESYYDLACQYYESNGNLVVSFDYVSNNLCLGHWISEQRQEYRLGKLSQYRIDKLEDIGMIWNTHDYIWEQYYDLATKYYEFYGNLNVNRRFTTKDGINADIEGLSLGQWICLQRSDYQKEKLSPDKVTKLNNIDMIWDIKLNKNTVKDLCLKYHIDYELNKTILKRIAIKELMLKIDYLQSINENIVDANGKLNKIFRMSNKDIMEEYGINLYQRDSIVRG